MITTTTTLIFVYNAKSGLISAFGDMVHKIVSPATYPCSLCALTYGAFSMRAEWRRFLDGTGLPTRFLYRDEFRNQPDARDLALPVILLGGQAPVLVSAAELNALPDLPALIALVEARLAAVTG
ncbi:hypothetical protein [uncultured Erythrobacter sp.]|uniref:hypothetical protein n=1 Tax=uncultured Erythrobacter sp. TaxID=263913 RepID=UPI00265A1DEA|nr:hypothetical protein [uncultured Erythrobacter sp.]